MSRRKGQRSDEEPPWNSIRKWLAACVQHCCLGEIQQTTEMTHSLKGSFTCPWDPPVISIIPKRKHFQWNSAIKKLCSHVNCFLYSAKQKKAGFTFFWSVCFLFRRWCKYVLNVCSTEKGRNRRKKIMSGPNDSLWWKYHQWCNQLFWVGNFFMGSLWVFWLPPTGQKHAV